MLGATSVTCGECSIADPATSSSARCGAVWGTASTAGLPGTSSSRPDQLYRLPDGTDAGGRGAQRAVRCYRAGGYRDGARSTGRDCARLGPRADGTAVPEAAGREGVKTDRRGHIRRSRTPRGGAAVRREPRWWTSRSRISPRRCRVKPAAVVWIVTFECAGHPDVGPGLPRHRCGRWAVTSQVAICGRDIPFPIDRVFYKQLTIAGSVCYTARTWRGCSRCLPKGGLASTDLVSHKLPITEWRNGVRSRLEPSVAQSAAVSRVMGCARVQPAEDHAAMNVHLRPDMGALPESVTIGAGQGALPRSRDCDAAAAAEIYLHGAHVTRWQPSHADAPVLWMSEQSFCQDGKPIRGGVPICFPWFGPHGADATAPAHGFGRLGDWTLVGAVERNDGRVDADIRTRGRTDVRASGRFASSASTRSPSERRCR